MKKLALALLANAVLVSCAFAGNPDLGPGENFSTKFDASDLSGAKDFAARSAEIDTIVKAGKQFDENVALVNQLSGNGHTTFAYVEQSGGQGNLAVINQDTRVNAGVAMIMQSGSGARAIINQH